MTDAPKPGTRGAKAATPGAPKVLPPKAKAASVLPPRPTARATPGRRGGRPDAEAAPSTTASSRRTATLDPDELAHLEEQRDFLLRSLADLEREHDAGDLDDVDYEALRDDYTARAAETLRAVQERRRAFEEAKPVRSPKQIALIVAGVVAFAAVAGILVAVSVGARQPGGVSSGGVTVEQTTSQKAQTCASNIVPPLAAKGSAFTSKLQASVDCFQAVLKKDPKNAVALTWLGWQLSLASNSTSFTATQQGTLLVSAGGFVDQAVKADPSYSYARAFRAVIAYQLGEGTKAQQYLDDFRSHDPSKDAEAVIEQEDLPAQIAALIKAQKGKASTTTTTTAASGTAPATTTTSAAAGG